MTKPSHTYCKDCKDWNGNISNCMAVCGIPMEIMEEWEQYRAIGTVNEFKALKEDWLNKFDRLIEYEKIGTVEKCREAVGKQKSKICDISGDGYADGHMVYDMYECPNCGKMYEIDCEKYEYCPNCGQHMLLEWSDEDETD